MPIADALTVGSASQSLRVELTAMEEFTQVDSTSLDIQILHDPFEQQNPFPNHELLALIAKHSGGPSHPRCHSTRRSPARCPDESRLAHRQQDAALEHLVAVDLAAGPAERGMDLEAIRGVGVSNTKRPF